MFKVSAVDVVLLFSTSCQGIGDIECEGEFGGDGVLLLGWPVNLDIPAIHS